jgi:hypothetical protein
LGKTFLHELILKKNLLQTNRPISIKLYAGYPCVKAIHVCLDKGTDQMGDDKNKCKY